MAQRIKVVAVKGDRLCPFPGTHMVMGKTDSHGFSANISMRSVAWVQPLSQGLDKLDSIQNK